MAIDPYHWSSPVATCVPFSADRQTAAWADLRPPSTDCRQGSLRRSAAHGPRSLPYTARRQRPYSLIFGFAFPPGYMPAHSTVDSQDRSSKNGANGAEAPSHPQS